ncbi:hypothetical protein [Nitrosomonas sp.]|uniref:lipase family protein n=1 Tax=Nitrosomonas sp. TaxID=42353 RepID=UPI0035B4BBFF
MKTKHTLMALLAAYLISANAVQANWDTNTAVMLATASECAYRVTSERQRDDDRINVLKCLKDAADENPESLREAFSRLNIHSVEVFSSPGSSGNGGAEIDAAILLKIPNGAIIAFRGTEPNKSDWLNNLKLFRFHDLDRNTRELLFEKGRHAGFERSLRSLHEKILQDQEIWQPFKNQAQGTLYLTGHSKGGALATGATVDFREDFTGEVITYTFAAPRFFTARGEQISKGFNKESNKESRPDIFDNLWRFEYQYDFVPHVPLGKVTYDILLEKLNNIPETLLPEEISQLKESLRTWVEDNNVNFVPVGKLMYANYQNELRGENLSASYPERFKDVAGKLGRKVLELILHPGEAKEIVKNPAKSSFFIGQHAQYLPYLKELSSNQAAIARPE